MELTNQQAPFITRRIFWLVIFCLFLAGFFINANDGFAYALRSEAPDGQLLYLLSKSVGLTALLMMWWQLFSALLNSSGLTNKTHVPIFKPGKETHIMLGSLLVLFIISHAGLFITAVTLRQESSALYLLIPNFSDFYHSALSLGVIGFFLVMTAVVMASLRRRMPRIWKLGHRLVLIAFALGAVHALLIGSEAGDGILFYLIIFLILTVIVLIPLTIWNSLSE